MALLSLLQRARLRICRIERKANFPAISAGLSTLPKVLKSKEKATQNAPARESTAAVEAQKKSLPK